MKAIIEELIKRYFELSLITTVMIPEKRGMGSSRAGSSMVRYHKVKVRAAKAWDVKDPTTSQYSDVLVEDLNDAEKEAISQQLFVITKAMIIADNKQEEMLTALKEKYLNYECKTFNEKPEDHLKIMEWCLIRLRAMGVISPFITMRLQPVYDNDDSFIGNKVVADEDTDDENEEEETP